MRKLHVSTKFKKDLRRIGKRGRDTDKPRNIIEKLIASEPQLARLEVVMGV